MYEFKEKSDDVKRNIHRKDGDRISTPLKKISVRQPVIQGSFISSTTFRESLNMQRTIQNHFIGLGTGYFTGPGDDFGDGSMSLKSYSNSMNLMAFCPLETSERGERTVDRVIPPEIADIADYKIFYKYRIAPFTTVGFEHEFFEFRSPHMKGMTHVKLAESEPLSDYTGLGFSLETDSGDKVELVSPPFLIETGKTPVPNPAAVASLNTQMEGYLKNVGTSFKEGTHASSLEALVTRINTDLGIRLDAGFAIPLETESVQEGTRFECDIPNEQFNREFNVFPMENINPQVNFATDAGSYHKIFSKTQEDGTLFSVTKKKHKTIETLLLGAKVGQMVTEYVAKVVTQIPVRQAEIYLHTLKQQKQEAVERGGDVDGKTKNTLQLLQAIVSGVKDVGRIWMKDYLCRYVEGVDPTGDSAYQLAILMEQNIAEISGEVIITQDDLNPLMRLINSNQEGFLPDLEYKINCKNVETLKSLIQGLRAETEAEAKQDFGGVRTDTFVEISPDKKPPAFRDRMLHIAELRPGGEHTAANSERLRLMMSLAVPKV